jgi:GNAT superfamily N-acetyltransferase
MGAEVTIRELTRGDLQPLLELYRHLHDQDDPVPDTAGETWEVILRDPAHVYLGAFVEQRLVAACNAAVIPNLTRGARPYAVIENVVTHADYRRRGIGARLVRALIERCWERRCYKVMLMSATRRADMHGFYEALGFDGGSKRAFVISAR